LPGTVIARVGLLVIPGIGIRHEVPAGARKRDGIGGPTCAAWWSVLLELLSVACGTSIAPEVMGNGANGTEGAAKKKGL
jgi:hypothetical protein